MAVSHPLSHTQLLLPTPPTVRTAVVLPEPVDPTPRTYCIDGHTWALSYTAVLGLSEGLAQIEPLESRMDRLGWQGVRDTLWMESCSRHEDTDPAER